VTISQCDADVIRVIAKTIDLEGYKDSARSLYDIADRLAASLVGVERAALPPLRAREETCGACGHPWTGEKCGQAENDHPFPTCYPVSSTAGQEWRDEEIRAETFDFAAKIAFERDDDRTGEALKELAAEIRRRAAPPVAEPKETP
jgi:hypothetical protein